MSDDERCGATCRDGTACQNYPVEGSNRCRMHGGKGSGNPDAEGAAITHGAQADPVNLHRHLDDDERAWVDKLVAGYLEEAPFGEDSPKVERLRMTCVVIYQEWSAREVVLRDGPSEEVTIGVNEAGLPVARTDEHHLTATASTHNQTVRMNLKDLGLLDDPDTQKADAASSLVDVLSE